MNSREAYEDIQYDSQKMGPGSPAMWLSEIACVVRILEEQSRDKEYINVLEYGSGNSTVYFPNLLRKKGVKFMWYAVENSIPWYEQVVSMVAKADLQGSVRCFLMSSTYEKDKDIQETLGMSEYINFPGTLDIEFDVIIVDGRKRGECLELASELLAPDGVAILHDAEREEYHPAFQHFVNGGQFVCENKSPVPGGVQKLWVGRSTHLLWG